MERKEGDGTGVERISAVDKIEEIRVKNNRNWMDLLRLAIKYVPKEELDLVLRGIVERDKQVVEAVEELIGK